MLHLILRSLVPLVIVLPFVISEDDEKQAKSICGWQHTECTNTQFQCFTSKLCIARDYYCNGEYNCGDNSDELYCDTNHCPTSLVKCDYSRKCIPHEWLCNGYTDCPRGDDERNCRSHTSRVVPAGPPMRTDNVLKRVVSWLKNQEKDRFVEKWGPNVDILALMFYFWNQTTTSSLEYEIKKEIVYELNIQLLSRLASKKLEDIPSTELASFVNAFLAMCINPRKFHGYDLINELRNRVDHQNYTNPYVLLALCNAGETITESDKSKLLDTFENKHRTFWTDMQAVVIMALACATKQPGNEMDTDTLREMTLELKQQQYRNGSVINLSTTALVLQALISLDSETDPDNFDEMKALQELLRYEKFGSFGDLMSTFLVIPVLVCRSLADIKSDHCQQEDQNEISALINLSRKSGPKMEIQYSLWIGNDKDLGRNLILRVPQNMSLYTIMETAAELDSRFKFEYSIKDRKPFINAISEMRDNPLTEKFWFLYVVENGNPTLINKSPADIIPRDNDHYVMWYRRGTWVD